MKTYPMEPLDRIYQNDTALADLLGLCRQMPHRWRKRGIPADWADTVAVRAGFHPSELWPEWLDDAEDEVCAWCGDQVPPTRETCSNRCWKQIRKERLFFERRLVEWWDRLDRYRDEEWLEVAA